jgi:putative ATPase
MAPLPEMLRPLTIEEFVGQKHLLGEDGPLSRLLKNDFLPSMILWGPPGVGKTTLAYILAKRFNYDFLELSGVEFSVKTLDKIKPKKEGTSIGLFDTQKRRGKGRK